MPIIKIDDLHPTGAELFSDSESYMNELSDNELEDINGGFTPVSVVVSIASRISVAVSVRSSMRCLQLSIKTTNPPTKTTPISPAISF